MDLLPGTCTLCKTEHKILPTKVATEFTDHITSAFLNNDTEKCDQFTKHKRSVKLCPQCAFKLEKADKFRERCEDTAKESKKRSTGECFLCNGSEYKFIKVEGLQKRIRVFGAVANTPPMVRQRVICMECVFELDLWCQMQKNVSEMFESWESPKTPPKSNTSTPEAKTAESRISPRKKDKSLVDTSTSSITDETEERSSTPVRGKTFFKINLGKKKKFCGTCKKSFVSLYQYNKHMQRYHNKTKSVVVNLLRYELPEHVKASEFLKKINNKTVAESKKEVKRNRLNNSKQEKTPVKRSPAVKKKRESIVENGGGRTKKRVKSKEKEQIVEKEVVERRCSPRKLAKETELESDENDKSISEEKTRNDAKLSVRRKSLNVEKLNRSEVEEKTMKKQNRRASKSPKKIQFADSKPSSSDEENTSARSTPRKVRFADRKQESSDEESSTTTDEESNSSFEEQQSPIKTTTKLVINLIKRNLPATTNARKFMDDHPDKYTKEYRSKSLADALLKKYIGEENLISLGLESYVHETEKTNDDEATTEAESVPSTEEESKKNEEDSESVQQTEATNECDEEKSEDNLPSERPEEDCALDKQAEITDESSENDVQKDTSSEREEEVKSDDNLFDRNNASSEQTKEIAEDDSSDKQTELSNEHSDGKSEDLSKNQREEINSENDISDNQETSSDCFAEKSEETSSENATVKSEGDSSDKQTETASENDGNNTSVDKDDSFVAEEQEKSEELVDIFTANSDTLSNCVANADALLDEIISRRYTKLPQPSDSESTDVIETTPDETNGINTNRHTNKTTDTIEDISSISNFIRETMKSPFEPTDKKRKSEESPGGLSQPKKKVRFALDSEDETDFSLLLADE